MIKQWHRMKVVFWRTIWLRTPNKWSTLLYERYKQAMHTYVTEDE